MKLVVLSALILSTVASVTHAETRLSGSEFESLVTGKTLYFQRGGQPFGTEQYYADKRVIWAFENGTCQRGIWFENAKNEICFVYDTQPGSICWTFSQDGGTYSARPVGDPPGRDLIVSGIDEEPINCPLPDLGV